MRVRSDDLLLETRELATSLEALLDDPALATPPAVWSIYARTEKTVAVLRFRLGVERPGLRLEVPRFQASEELLRRTLGHMRDAAMRLEKGSPPRL